VSELRSVPAATEGYLVIGCSLSTVSLIFRSVEDVLSRVVKASRSHSHLILYDGTPDMYRDIVYIEYSTNDGGF
jgi:hypothetical protein